MVRGNKSSNSNGNSGSNNNGNDTVVMLMEVVVIQKSSLLLELARSLAHNDETRIKERTKETEDAG